MANDEHVLADWFDRVTWVGLLLADAEQDTQPKWSVTWVEKDGDNILYLNDASATPTYREVEAPEYTRQRLVLTKGDNVVTFTRAVGSWGRVEAFGLFTQSTGGELILTWECYNRPIILTADTVVVTITVT